MTSVDVLIVGGGPAGLLAADLLSQTHRVALVDKSRLGYTTKYWVTVERRLRMYNLDQCVLHKSSLVSVGTFLGGRATASGEVVVVDERRLMTELLERCRNAGVLLREQSPVMNVTWETERLRVRTVNEEYSCRVVVDATGTQSPFVAAFRMHKLYGFYTVFGALISPIRLITDEIALAYLNELGDPPTVLEVIPTGHDSAYCVVFTYSKELIEPHHLRASFSRQCQSNPFFQVTSETKEREAKSGAIAIGRRRRRALPGIVQIGEADIVQPPLLGTAFNAILEYAKSNCTAVSEALTRSSGPVEPLLRYPLMKDCQDAVQLLMARMLLNRNVELFDDLVRFIATLRGDTVHRLFSNELTWRELAGITFRLPLHMLLRRSAISFKE